MPPTSDSTVGRHLGEGVEAGDHDVGPRGGFGGGRAGRHRLEAVAQLEGADADPESGVGAIEPVERRETLGAVASDHRSGRRPHQEHLVAAHDRGSHPAGQRGEEGDATAVARGVDPAGRWPRKLGGGAGTAQR